MSNYCDEPFYQQNIYPNTYSLWGNSVFYDINNLSPQNFSSSWHCGNDEDYETRYTSGPTEDEGPPVPKDHRNRRIVNKISLYDDPAMFYENMPVETPVKQWTRLHWHRPGEELEEGPSSSRNKGKMVRANRVQKKLDKMLAKPVKMGVKAESMMQKMGWHGGALGLSNSGIIDPVTPNSVYATKNVGFGQSINQPIQPRKPAVKNDSSDYFTMNVLYNIYEFAKNNTEIELLFDSALYKEERKRIYNIVEFMLNVESVATVERDAQTELILQICDINCYVLRTQTEGEYPNRSLCIYKEAPLHVYLIIPDDLRDTPPDPESDSKSDEISDNEVEEETNPFLRSITRNLKKTKDEKVVVPEKEVSIPERILEFFIEFTEKKQYNQFKFLGPFNGAEREAIQEFMDNASLYIYQGICKNYRIFSKINFEIVEDITGNTIINKIRK